MIRMSIPGNACIHCDWVMGQDLKCEGCGHIDPMTKTPDRKWGPGSGIPQNEEEWLEARAEQFAEMNERLKRDNNRFDVV